jgi:hypothetical protein
VQYVVLACRCAVAVVFAVAVVGKSRRSAAFRAFRGSVREMVPELPATATGAAIIVSEASVVALLAVGRTVPIGFMWAGTVLLTFSAGIGRALRAGSRTPCGCFGATAAPLSARHLVRNGGILAIAVLGLTLGFFAHGPLRLAGIVLGLATAAVLALMVIFFEDLADLFASTAT